MDICKYCGQNVKKGNKFCSKSHAASFNNIGVRRHGVDPGSCLNCGKQKKRKESKYCSIKCYTDYRYKQNIKSWLSGEHPGHFVRRYLFEKNDNGCQICGWDKVHPITKKIPLQVHHKDGDCTNNKLENIELLCPNCHSLTETYCSLNKNSKRTNKKGRK